MEGPHEHPARPDSEHHLQIDDETCRRRVDSVLIMQGFPLMHAWSRQEQHGKALPL